MKKKHAKQPEKRSGGMFSEFETALSSIARGLTDFGAALSEIAELSKQGVAPKRGRPSAAKPGAKRPGRPAKAKKRGRPSRASAKRPASKAKPAKRAKPAARTKSKPRATAVSRSAKPKLNVSSLDYSLDFEEFAKKYAYGRGGTKKFVLLIARRAKGKANVGVPIAAIRSEWARLQGKNQLGAFNGLYPNQAKSQGWVRSPKRGIYSLSSSWMNCF